MEYFLCLLRIKLYSRNFNLSYLSRERNITKYYQRKNQIVNRELNQQQVSHQLK